MRKILIAAVAMTAFAAPAFADPPSDAVKTVVEKGLMIDIMGMPIDFKFNADGTFAAMQGAFPGKYKADGKKICITSDAMPEESCMEIPDGKKSGDKFTLTLGQLGDTEATIQ